MRFFSRDLLYGTMITVILHRHHEERTYLKTYVSGKDTPRKLKTAGRMVPHGPRGGFSSKSYCSS